MKTTTGPLGQGVATSVGMAAASRWLAERYNEPGFRLFDFDVYALMGDGCMMEGVSSEAASLAGHLRLDNLCWSYDNNHITIEGPTSLAFSEDVATRYQISGWNVTRVGDANDLDMLSRAFDTFKATSGRPTLIIVDTHIGYGAPHKQYTPQAHSEPFGEEEVRAAKRFYGWPEDARFLVPEGCMSTSGRGSASAGRRHGRPGLSCSKPIARPDPGQIRLRARPCDRGGQGPAGPLAPGMSHVPALSARHQKEGRMP